MGNIKNIFTVDKCSPFFCHKIDYKKYLSMIVTGIIAYGLNYIVVATDIRKIFKYSIDYDYKTMAQYYEGNTRLIIYLTFVFLIGSYSDRFDVWVITSTIISSLLFTIINGIDDALHTNLTSFDKWPIRTYIYAGVLTFILLVIGSNIIYNSFKCKQIYHLLFLICGVAAYIYFFYIFKTKRELTFKQNGETIHIHHWNLFMALSILMRYNTVISKIGSGITLGIMIQGLALYNDAYSVN
jgi:hypothetical protein